MHGPVLTDNLGYYLNLYNVWSSYSAETDGVFIAYASVYGHTEKAAKLLAAKLEEKGVKVAISDLACPTYNGDAFPAMREFIAKLVERSYQSRKIALIENGTWAPMSAKVMKSMFEGSKNIEFVEPSVKILSAMTAQNEQEIENLAVELAK